jgi:hypothetical protein
LILNLWKSVDLLLHDKLKRIEHKKTERPMCDIGLSRLAETFSLKVTVLTPVTWRLVPAILSTYRAASIKQSGCLLSEVIFFAGTDRGKIQRTIPKNGPFVLMAEPTGLEPATSDVTGTGRANLG